MRSDSYAPGSKTILALPPTLPYPLNHKLFTKGSLNIKNKVQVIFFCLPKCPKTDGARGNDLHSPLPPLDPAIRVPVRIGANVRLSTATIYRAIRDPF